MFTVIDELTVDPQVRVYAEGWQSWSPTAWWPVGTGADRPEHQWQHLMRGRADKSVPSAGCQGEGLVVVDPGEGSPVVRYAITEARSSVTTIRARCPRPGRVEVSSDGPLTRTVHPTAMAALTGFGAAFGQGAGVRATAMPRVWCSWYQYFEHLMPEHIDENLAHIDAHELPVDLVQVDDGWGPGPGLGEYGVAWPHFGDLGALAGRIQDSGRRAGLWLAPFLAGNRSTLAREHPDWLVGPAGTNWGQNLLGLDLTHPAVGDLISQTVARVCGQGFSYLKLDFLYAGAIAGPRHAEVSPVEAYRHGLALIREAAGPDVLILGCGAPMLPSVGLVDAMRVSPDTFHEGGQDGSQGLRGAGSLRARAWQDGLLWANDPDCLVARPSFARRDDWADILRGRGQLRSFSDRVADLDQHGLDLVRRHLLGH